MDDFSQNDMTPSLNRLGVKRYFKKKGDKKKTVEVNSPAQPTIYDQGGPDRRVERSVNTGGERDPIYATAKRYFGKA